MTRKNPFLKYLITFSLLLINHSAYSSLYHYEVKLLYQDYIVFNDSLFKTTLAAIEFGIDFNQNDIVPSAGRNAGPIMDAGKTQFIKDGLKNVDHELRYFNAYYKGQRFDKNDIDSFVFREDSDDYDTKWIAANSYFDWDSGQDEGWDINLNDGFGNKFVFSDYIARDYNSSVVFEGLYDLGEIEQSITLIEETPTIVPIPPAVYLFGFAIASLGLFRRRSTRLLSRA